MSKDINEMNSEPLSSSPDKSVYEVVLMVNGIKKETYVEAILKSDVFDIVARSKKSVSIVSIRPVGPSLCSILQ